MTEAAPPEAGPPAGHADSRTMLTYIRSRDRLSKPPAYVLR
ncbi:MAG TPA: hypothetical protein VJ739_08915 [Gemmataceae bacterium]|nr:hypothetical protein [Gemmataceae bacterium]